MQSDNVDSAFIKAAKDVYFGVVTMRYETDYNGEMVGIKKGNVELSASKRHSYTSRDS